MTLNYLPADTPVMIREMRHHRLGLSYTRTGYGAKIPTQYMVPSVNPKRMLRVYATCFSNAASLWVESRGVRYYLPSARLNVVSACQGVEIGS